MEKSSIKQLYWQELPLEFSKQLFQNSYTGGRFTIKTPFKSLGKMLHSGGMANCLRFKRGHVLTDLPQTFSAYMANTCITNWLFCTKVDVEEGQIEKLISPTKGMDIETTQIALQEKSLSEQVSEN